MGFIKPNLPVVDLPEWTKRPRAERIVPMARHIAENGFGTPLVMHVMYGVKIALYILGGWAVRVVDEGDRRVHRRRYLVVGTDRVSEGRALHDAVRGRRPRLLLRAAGRALLPTDRFDPVLAAAGHHPVATLARPGAADPRATTEARSTRCSTARCSCCS